MFRAASVDDIEAYSDSVTCFIRKCVEDVVPTKTIRIYPNQKPWINSDVRAALSARTSAFKSGNFDDRKQASYDLRKSIKAAKRQYKNKVEEQFNTNNARSMLQSIINITDFKGNKSSQVKSSLLYCQFFHTVACTDILWGRGGRTKKGTKKIKIYFNKHNQMFLYRF